MHNDSFRFGFQKRFFLQIFSRPEWTRSIDVVIIRIENVAWLSKPRDVRRFGNKITSRRSWHRARAATCLDRPRVLRTVPLVPREIADTDRLSYCTCRVQCASVKYTQLRRIPPVNGLRFLFSIIIHFPFQITVNESLRVCVAGLSRAAHSAARVGFKYSDGDIDSETSTRKNLG